MQIGSWLKVNKISNQTAHHQSATKFESMLQDIKNYQPVKLLKYLLHFWYCAKKKNGDIFNQVNTDWLIIFLLNTVIEKNQSLENRIRRQTRGWVTRAKPSRRNTNPGFSHTVSPRFLKQNYPTYISDVVSKILEEKKTQLSDVLSELVIFLKLGFLWWKLKILIANFPHVSPNQFWQIFSMLLSSHPTIKWRWKKILLQLVWG